MTLYLDTSSLVKIYVVESGYDRVLDQLDAASVVATSTVAYAEARAAFTRRHREGVLTAAGYATAKRDFDADWGYYLALDVTATLTDEAGSLSERFGLRGFDSLHLATFAAVARTAPGKTQFSSFDDKLNRAARRLVRSN